jgi:branched-chain amino acid transport system ATP-binding protein
MRDDGGTSIERRHQLAKTTSGGEQQMLAIACALMSEPKILLLDEPSLGLSPLLVKDLFAILRSSIITKDRAVVLVEQNVHQSIRLADRVYVLENGRIVRSGSQAEIREDAIVSRPISGAVRHCHKASGQTAASVAARRKYRNPVEERCGFW